MASVKSQLQLRARQPRGDPRRNAQHSQAPSGHIKGVFKCPRHPEGLKAGQCQTGGGGVPRHMSKGTAFLSLVAAPQDSV